MSQEGNCRARIGAGGRIVIPARYRRALNLKVGEEVMLRLDDGELRMLSVDRAIERAQASVRRYTRGKRSLVKLLLAQRRAEARRE